MTTAKQRREQAKLLRLQIAINRMVPDWLRCDDAIVEMEEQLARLEQPHLTLVVNHNKD
jgi:hypothetical protein